MILHLISVSRGQLPKTLGMEKSETGASPSPDGVSDMDSRHFMVPQCGSSQKVMSFLSEEQP